MLNDYYNKVNNYHTGANVRDRYYSIYIYSIILGNNISIYEDFSTSLTYIQTAL